MPSAPLYLLVRLTFRNPRSQSGTSGKVWSPEGWHWLEEDQRTLKLNTNKSMGAVGMPS